MESTATTATCTRVLVLQGNEQTINLRRCIGVYEAIRAETWLPLIWRSLGTDSTVAEAANAEVQAISRLSKK